MPFKILRKHKLEDSGTLYEMDINATLIARKAFAGHFIILRVNERGERIPLTIADYDRDKGFITIVFQVVGKSTLLLSHQKTNDEILDIVGPLGNEIRVEKYEFPVVIIGGGVGIAECYPQAKELKKVGNEIISIIGARTKDFLFWKDKMAAVSNRLIICTNDGSEGIKGFVTKPLQDLLKNEEISVVITIGPLIMMKNISSLTDGSTGLPKVKTYVSLNTIMIDGTGLCGGCRFFTHNGEIRFACVDGPTVDGHIIDFNNLINRANRFSDQEKKSFEKFKNECKNLGGAK
ncbi:MAG: Sulfide dehydrogenase subunit beta precursor [Candidatus Lokiarchaeum sp. GC14_75]|nr:MAG: Sulfide dehydrogenase subunit beta precursor [Candidatus Lokiarchaeum sp. GC14_75]